MNKITQKIQLINPKNKQLLTNIGVRLIDPEGNYYPFVNGGSQNRRAR